LDRLDEDSRRRRQRVHVPDPPTNGNRDDIAAWLANRHFLVAPAEYEFEIWQNLQDSPANRAFLNLTRRLFAAADAYL
jgi:hypothetical protein